MAKKQKTQRPKAQTPKGFRDYFGAEVAKRTEMLRTIARVYQLYGFEVLEAAAELAEQGIDRIESAKAQNCRHAQRRQS